MHLDQRAKETSSLISILLEVEKEPSTQHTHYFKDYRQNFLHFTRVYSAETRTAISSGVCRGPRSDHQSLL